jgi:hypothetical protein
MPGTSRWLIVRVVLLKPNSTAEAVSATQKYRPEGEVTIQLLCDLQRGGKQTRVVQLRFRVEGKGMPGDVATQYRRTECCNGAAGKIRPGRKMEGKSRSELVRCIRTMNQAAPLRVAWAVQIERDEPRVRGINETLRAGQLQNKHRNQQTIAAEKSTLAK